MAHGHGRAGRFREGFREQEEGEDRGRGVRYKLEGEGSGVREERTAGA